MTVRAVGQDIIKVYGCIEDERACQLSLNRWLSRQTREHLIPRLQILSAGTGLKYRQVFIRQQKTRWASCSRHRNISLNLKLLFLPPALVDYVLIHELCHIAEMSHSKEFWAEVSGIAQTIASLMRNCGRCGKLCRGGPPRLTLTIVQIAHVRPLPGHKLLWAVIEGK